MSKPGTHRDRVETVIAKAKRFIAAADSDKATPEARLHQAAVAFSYGQMAVFEAAHEREGNLEEGPTGLQTEASKVCDEAIYCLRRTIASCAKESK